jgi:hypothetical protein
LEVTPTSAPGLGSRLPSAHLPPLPWLLPAHAHSHVQGRVHARTPPPSMANTCTHTATHPSMCAHAHPNGWPPRALARRAPCFLQAMSARARGIVRTHYRGRIASAFSGSVPAPWIVKASR